LIGKECPDAVEAICGESEKRTDRCAVFAVHGESPPMTTERDEGCEEGRDES